MVDNQSAAPDGAGDSDVQTVQQAYAVVFLQDLATNKSMGDAWNALLKQVGDSTAPVDERRQAVDNFLGNWGYDTTAADVLSIIRAPWWVAAQAAAAPNAESDRFVQTVLQDTSLYKAYVAALGAAQQQQKLAVVDDFLNAQGYGCTAVQVDASFRKMRDQNLNFWSGIYGETALVADDSTTPAAGPALIVYGDTSVSLGAARLYDPSYANGVLSWELASKDGLFTNPCSAELTFSQISMPVTDDPAAYIGNEFNGTVIYAAGASGSYTGKYTFTGRIGEPPPNRPGKVVTPPSYNRSEIEDIFKYINYFVIGHMAISALVALPKQAKALYDWYQERQNKRAAAEQEEVEKQVEGLGEESPVAKEKFSESTEIEQLEGENPGDLAQREGQVEEAEETFESEETAETAEGGEVEGGEEGEPGEILESLTEGGGL